MLLKKTTAKILTFSVCVVPENTLSDTSPTVEVGFCHRPCWILDVGQLFNSSKFIKKLCPLCGHIFHSAIFKNAGNLHIGVGFYCYVIVGFQVCVIETRVFSWLLLLKVHFLPHAIFLKILNVFAVQYFMRTKGF